MTNCWSFLQSASVRNFLISASWRAFCFWKWCILIARQNRRDRLFFNVRKVIGRLSTGRPRCTPGTCSRSSVSLTLSNNHLINEFPKNIVSSTNVRFIANSDDLTGLMNCICCSNCAILSEHTGNTPWNGSLSILILNNLLRMSKSVKCLLEKLHLVNSI